MPIPSKFGVQIGDRVRLEAFEDQPEEYGELLSWDRTTAIVCLEGKPTRDDDRLREVPHSQIHPA